MPRWHRGSWLGGRAAAKHEQSRQSNDQPRPQDLGLRRANMGQNPIWVAVFQVSLEQPEFCSAPVINALAFRAFRATAIFCQEPHTYLCEIALDVRFFYVGAGWMKELHHLRPSRSFAVCNRGFKALENIGREQPFEGITIPCCERAHDHLISASGAPEEFAGVEARVPGFDCRQTRGLNAELALIFDGQFWVGRGHRGQVRFWIIAGLASDASS